MNFKLEDVVYTSHKQVKRVAMTFGEYEKARKAKANKELKMGQPATSKDFDADAPGCLVAYENETYFSWSPKEAFDNGYSDGSDKVNPVATTEKTLKNTEASGAKVNVADIQFWGDGDTFELLCKASSLSEGWMKSTKAMQVGSAGCVVQVTTQQRNQDGSYAVAEAVTFVPGAKINRKTDRNGVVLKRWLS